MDNEPRPDFERFVQRAQKLLMGTNILRRIFTAPGVLTPADVQAVMHPFIADVPISATGSVCYRGGEHSHR
jgi:hypothetical protein